VRGERKELMSSRQGVRHVTHLDDNQGIKLPLEYHNLETNTFRVQDSSKSVVFCCCKLCIVMCNICSVNGNYA